MTSFSRWSLPTVCLFLVSFLLPLTSVQAQDADNANTVHDSTHFDDLEYRMVGPYRGGRSTAVTGIAGKPDTYFMGTTGGGVWKTTNAGQDWHNISDGDFEVSSIGGIDVANSDPSVIYVGTGSACMRGNIQTGRGVYKSNDGGNSWSFVGLPDAGLIGKVAVHPKDPDVAYVAAVGHPFGDNEQRGVFRTTDGGDSWEKVLYISDSTGVVDLALNPENPREIYAGLWPAQRTPWTMVSGSKEGGIYKSTDGGDNWTELTNGLPQGVVGKTSVTVSPAEPSRVWALIEAPEPKGGLYRSDDHGKTWTQVNDNRKHLQRSWYYTHIYADPQDENTVYSLNVRFHKSVDGGKSFEAKGVPHGDVHDLWLNPNDPDRMIVANDGGAQVSVDGAETWSTYFNQPTAEMYSVTVDDEFPYHIYGPQQDNSTIRLPAWGEGSIHPKRNWKSVGGCETGPVALHPDRPWLIYSGCYGGHLSRMNLRTEQSRNVMVYPQLQLGQAPRTLRERFQWNAPIEVSPHDPDVVYHASHRIWRSTDRGMSWTRVSGDLTTDTEAHQDFAGEPITKDNTGVEVFNTVFSLQVSPHAAETLWAGTDDGRVWISRDEGSNWNEITPDDLPEYGTVQRIEVSPHDAGTAYIAVHRYRLDDWTPYVFRTTDYGESWTRIATGNRGIPDDSPVWVVREDPDREGLLYAGTEFGLYVSFNDGRDWQSLQQNLPITRVPDLKVKDNDLVVATHGRSYWIMDDLTPLRQLTDRVAEKEMHLFSPPAAHLVGTYGSDADNEDREPAGKPGGATIDYLFAEAPDTTVTLDVLDSNGSVVQSFTSDKAAAQKNGDPVLPAKAGMNRFQWSLRADGVNTVDDAILWGFTGGPKVVPGTYTARLATAAGDTLTQTFDVKMDPRLENVTKADLQTQYNLATSIRDSLNAVYDAIRTIRSVRKQVNAVAEHAAEAGHDGLTTQADSISEKLTAIEQELMQTKNESFQDPLNFPPQLDNQYAYLYGFVAGPDGPPTESARTRFQDVNEQWEEHRRRLQTILDTDVTAFSQRVRELQSEPVFVPTSM
jgi:photosystem II stability/assembly factor-like uncharacterized protein